MKKMIQFCTFRLEDRLFGVDLLDVREINPQVEFTPIFHAPSRVKGYVNIRGQIHLVLDLRLFFGFKKRTPDRWSRIVLFKQEVGESFGVLVDSVGDVVEVSGDEIEESREEIESEGFKPSGAEEICSGVCRLEKELLIVLNTCKLLDHMDL